MDAKKVLKSIETLHDKILQLSEEYYIVRNNINGLNESQEASLTKLGKDIDSVLRNIQTDINLLGVMVSANLDAKNYHVNETRTAINNIEIRLQAFEKIARGDSAVEPDRE